MPFNTMYQAVYNSISLFYFSVSSLSHEGSYHCKSIIKGLPVNHSHRVACQAQGYMKEGHVSMKK